MFTLNFHFGLAAGIQPTTNLSALLQILLTALDLTNNLLVYLRDMLVIVWFRDETI